MILLKDVAEKEWVSVLHRLVPLHNGFPFEKIERMRASLKRVACRGVPVQSGSPRDSYLVDPASSHMLVSKIKPCMSKYKH